MTYRPAASVWLDTPRTTSVRPSAVSASWPDRLLAVLRGCRPSDGRVYIRLVCGQLFTTTPPAVQPFKYHFFLFGEGSADAHCTDIDGDGDLATDADIECFFACFAGNCGACAGGTGIGADYDCDGDTGTDADIEAFFSALAGSPGECDCP